MKNYSDLISKTDIDAVDAKQTAEIKNLRRWLVCAVVFNLLVSIGLFLAV